MCSAHFFKIKNIYSSLILSILRAEQAAVGGWSCRVRRNSEESQVCLNLFFLCKNCVFIPPLSIHIHSLSVNDTKEFMKRFAELDTDHDGHLSPRELAVAVGFEPGSPLAEDLFARFDQGC